MVVSGGEMEVSAMVKRPMAMWGSESAERVCVRWNEEEEEAGSRFKELFLFYRRIFYQ